MGALCFGTALGYTSPAGPLLTYNTTEEEPFLSEEELSWFSSSVNLGALAGGPIGGLCINFFGRRGTMLISVIPFLGSWALIGLGQNLAMLISGRIIVGLCTGVTCIAVPTYIGEFASADIRGTLGSAFQLMAVTGILYAYVLGAIMETWQGMAGICAIPPVLYFLLLLFMKESPSFLLSKGRVEEAKAVLQYFRGPQYNIQPELDVMQQALDEAKHMKMGLKDMKTPYILKPFLLSLALMLFQQFSGINAVVFNLTTIFNDSGSNLSDNTCTIIVGVVQVLATALAAILMDKAGRKLLLIVSAITMAVSLVALGVFFYLKYEDEQHTLNTLGWLPLVSIILFITAFSIGYGPIPWLMMGELFSANVREVASSLATMTNWFSSFVVTVIFLPLQNALGDYGVYWLFGIVCAVNAVFSFLMVVETKGKTLQEITAIFGGPTTVEKKRESSKVV